MSLKLGIDTGGTYTDAIIFSEQTGVCATAKALTTRHDLALGVRTAMTRVLNEIEDRQNSSLDLVAVSTTLATNAIVEGEGARTCLILIGQPQNILERADLGSAIGDDYVARVDGGHQASGEAATELDNDAIRQLVLEYADRVQSFAVASYFAVRNPEHELAARELILKLCGLPVSLSHELSSNLDAPRRALTTLFNARLIPLLRELITSVLDEMGHHHIHAPLMVVQGDGSLVEAQTALHRPVETILSGPAASVTGARYLSKVDNALVSDIGGTTTDIAIIRDGLPNIENDGATVANWKTMVRAVQVHTVGLGGDSEVSQCESNKIVLGPRRAIPLALAVANERGIKDILKRQLLDADRETIHHLDGEFGVRIRHLNSLPNELSNIEQETWQLLESGPCPLKELFANPRRESALARLRRRGLATRIGFTPTDAAHVLELQSHLERETAVLAAEIWARRFGFADSEYFCQSIVKALHRQSATALSEAALMVEKWPPAKLDPWFIERSFKPDQSRFLHPCLRLSQPVIGIGAPAATFYTDIAQLLNTEAIVPSNAEVCNAVGAVVSGVIRTIEMLVTSPAEGIFRLHSPQGISDHAHQNAATDTAIEIGNRLAEAAALEAGAKDITLEQQVHHEIARGADGSETYIEGRICIVAKGKPTATVTKCNS